MNSNPGNDNYVPANQRQLRATTTVVSDGTQIFYITSSANLQNIGGSPSVGSAWNELWINGQYVTAAYTSLVYGAPENSNMIYVFTPPAGTYLLENKMAGQVDFSVTQRYFSVITLRR